MIVDVVQIGVKSIGYVEVVYCCYIYLYRIVDGVVVGISCSEIYCLIVGG